MALSTGRYNRNACCLLHSTDENIPAFLHQLLSVDGPLKMISRFRQLAEIKDFNLPGLAWMEE